jgi:MFS family permease
MLAALGIDIACAAFLVVATVATISHPWPFFAVAAVLGGARAFLSPAATAVLPMLVPPDKLARAVSLNQLADQAGWLIGPWLGGALCAVSIAAAYSVVATLYTAAVAALLLVRIRTRPERQPGSQVNHIREGLIYVWTNKIVLGAISLDLFAVLIGGVTALLPAFAGDVLNVGASGFGALRSAPAVGAAMMALAVTRWPLNRRPGRWLFAGVAAFGVSILAFAVSKSLYFSLVALAALGASDMISVYIRQTLIQVATPEHMRGRVSAVAGIFISGSAELGEFETGFVARLLGPIGAAIFGGVGTLAVAGAWSRMFPSLRDADRLDGAATQA